MTEVTESQLSTLIGKMVEEKTFSLDAINAISKVRDQAVELEKKLNYAFASVESGKRERAQLEYKISQFEAAQKKAAERDAAVSKREEIVTNLEKGTAVAQAQYSVLDGVFKTIFANRGVREIVAKSIPIALPGSNGCSGYVSNHVETTTTDTTES